MPNYENEELSKFIKTTKYLQPGEDHEEGCTRVAHTLKDNNEHFIEFRDILLDERFLPGGRVQVAIGATRETTANNCYVSGTIEDSMDGIVDKLGEAVQTMRLGGGIGYDFSSLRPSGERIRSLDSSSCGPVGDDRRSAGFMDLFDAACSVISSAGHRRGAQMGVLRVDHPDIRYFIRSKRISDKRDQLTEIERNTLEALLAKAELKLDPGRLRNFNISVGVTNDFMDAVRSDSSFDLQFGGRTYQKVKARNLWDEIMRSTWDYAEPGVLFLDTINGKNNLWYCEDICATNPCGEQPLPPYGACLLGSFNLTKYIRPTDGHSGVYEFNWEKFSHDIPHVVRAMDNVVDNAIYPLSEQEYEAHSKRRMGLGIMGLANTAEILGFPYGSQEMLTFTENIFKRLQYSAYKASVALAIEKGPFERFEIDYTSMQNPNSYFHRLPEDIQEDIKTYGIRNSHLLSIAPTGTISLSAGNISSGIEPPYTSGPYHRNVFAPDGGIRSFTVCDYAEAKYGVVGKTSDEVTLEEHVAVLSLASKYVDSAVSKTCNVGRETTFEEFEGVYMDAYLKGCSGITTFRPAEYGGKRTGIMSKSKEQSTPVIEQGGACYFDEQGNRTCDS